MKNLYSGIQRFIRDEEGVTAIEYALIASLIAVVIIGAVTLTGTRVNQVFSDVCRALNNNTACGTAG
jgi:pilus assembly protein Flp/PilA